MYLCSPNRHNVVHQTLINSCTHDILTWYKPVYGLTIMCRWWLDSSFVAYRTTGFASKVWVCLILGSTYTSLSFASIHELGIIQLDPMFTMYQASTAHQPYFGNFTVFRWSCADSNILINTFKIRKNVILVCIFVSL